MMQGEHNHFGKTSKLSIRAEVRDGKTVLTDVDFTAPYKIMKPFPLKNGGIRVMLLAASAGIMDGDRHEFCFDIREGAHVEFVSQSYDKVHPMEKDCAKRHTQIKVAKMPFLLLTHRQRFLFEIRHLKIVWTFILKMKVLNFG